MTNHWILVVREQRIGRTVLGAMDILQNRIRNRFWAFGKRARGIRLLRKGDRALIYASGTKSKDFVGQCEINSSPYELSRKRREMVIGNPGYAIDLDNFQLFAEPRSAKTFIPKLQFVRNKQNWGAYFQGSAIRIPEEDYQLIASETAKKVDAAERDSNCPAHICRYEAVPFRGESITLRRCQVCGLSERE